MAGSMAQIAQSGQEISKIVRSIDEIAFHLNFASAFFRHSGTQKVITKAVYGKSGIL